MREVLVRAAWWMSVPLVLMMVIGTQAYSAARAEDAHTEALRVLREENIGLAYQHAIMSSQHIRSEAILHYSQVYRIDGQLATWIHDIALAEGISLPIAFKLVDVESAFNYRAVSRVGAIGLAQVMPSTANDVEGARVPLRELFDPANNLRLGFRYLDYLLDAYDGDLRLALLAYNRGPRRVNGLLASNVDPANGYAESICGPCGSDD